MTTSGEIGCQEAVYRLLAKVLDVALDWKVVGILCGTFLGYVALLPPHERSQAAVGEFLSFADPDSWIWPLVCFILLCALGVVLLVAWVTHKTAQSRIEAQGSELATLRALHHDPLRMSSEDGLRLERYAEKRAERLTEEVREHADSADG